MVSADVKHHVCYLATTQEYLFLKRFLQAQLVESGTTAFSSMTQLYTELRLPLTGSPINQTPDDNFSDKAQV